MGSPNNVGTAPDKCLRYVEIMQCICLAVNVSCQVTTEHIECIIVFTSTRIKVINCGWNSDENIFFGLYLSYIPSCSLRPKVNYFILIDVRR